MLVDVEPDTLNIDPDQVEAAVRKTPRVKAIMPVHLYGHPADMDPIYDIAQRHGIAVIEDAAHALPARYRGRMIGAPNPGFDFPNLVAFSFYATKNLTTGEGGMLTGPQALIDDARVWSLHGMSRDAFKRYTSDGSWRYDVVLPGFKYNMPDIQAAIGLHQLKRLDAMQRRRRVIVAQYEEARQESIVAIRSIVSPVVFAESCGRIRQVGPFNVDPEVRKIHGRRIVIADDQIRVRRRQRAERHKRPGRIELSELVPSHAVHGPVRKGHTRIFSAGRNGLAWR